MKYLNDPIKYQDSKCLIYSYKKTQSMLNFYLFLSFNQSPKQLFPSYSHPTPLSYHTFHSHHKTLLTLHPHPQHSLHTNISTPLTTRTLPTTHITHTTHTQPTHPTHISFRVQLNQELLPFKTQLSYLCP